MVSDKIRYLSRGPLSVARRYTGYIVNGFRFHTRSRERRLRTQNCGVLVTAKTTSVASAKDRRPVIDDVNYYGALTDIIELSYSGRFKVILFRCDWVDINRGCKKDAFGFTLLNFSHLSHVGTELSDDPFVFASQVKKVYYVHDDRHKDWCVVMPVKVRDSFDMGDDVVVSRHGADSVVSESTDGEHNLVREDVDDLDEDEMILCNENDLDDTNLVDDTEGDDLEGYDLEDNFEEDNIEDGSSENDTEDDGDMNENNKNNSEHTSSTSDDEDDDY